MVSHFAGSWLLLYATSSTVRVPAFPSTGKFRGPTPSYLPPAEGSQPFHLKPSSASLPLRPSSLARLPPPPRSVLTRQPQKRSCSQRLLDLIHHLLATLCLAILTSTQFYQRLFTCVVPGFSSHCMDHGALQKSHFLGATIPSALAAKAPGTCLYGFVDPERQQMIPSLSPSRSRYKMILRSCDPSEYCSCRVG